MESAGVSDTDADQPARSHRTSLCVAVFVVVGVRVCVGFCVGVCFCVPVCVFCERAGMHVRVVCTARACACSSCAAHWTRCWTSWTANDPCCQTVRCWQRSRSYTPPVSTRSCARCL